MAEATRVKGDAATAQTEVAPCAVGRRWRVVGRWGANGILALLWGKFALNAYHQWTDKGSLILAGLMLYNTLLVMVTLARRPSLSTSTQLKDWAVALLTVTFSLSFRPHKWDHALAQVGGSLLQGIGLLVMVVALANLGRSFGVVAANRGIKQSGPYKWVRHPLYAGELTLFTGFLLTAFSPYNVIVWFGLVFGLVIRAWAEENHLSRDSEYQAYMKAVPYSFFPGLF